MKAVNEIACVCVCVCLPALVSVMEEVRNRCPLRHDIISSMPESASSDSMSDNAAAVQQQQQQQQVQVQVSPQPPQQTPQQLTVPQFHGGGGGAAHPPQSVSTTRRQRSWDTLDASAMAQARTPSRPVQQSPTQVGLVS